MLARHPATGSRTGSAFVRYSLIALCSASALLLLLLVQRSALRVLRESNNVGIAQANPTPLLDLTGVEIRARQSGRQTLGLKADRLTLSRNLHVVGLSGVSEGVAFASGKPLLRFSAGGAQFLMGGAELSGGMLHLDNAVADTAEAGVPVHVSTPALQWRWPHGLVQTLGPVHARIAGLGTVQAASLAVDPVARVASFGPLQAVIPLSVLPIAAANAPPATQRAGSPPRSSDIHFYAKEAGRYDENTSTLTIAGPVTVQQGNVTMQTVGVVYDHRANVAHAQSPVTIKDGQNILTGTNGSVNFRTHIATLDGDVHMSAVPSGSRPSGSLESEAHQPTKLLCDHVAYNYRTKLADASGHLKVLQTNRTVIADTGHYDTNAQLITLKGDVDGRSTDGKHLTAPEAVVSVKTGSEWIEVKGPITYSFTVNDEDNPIPPAARSGSAAKPTSH